MKSKFRFLFVLVPVAFITLGAVITMGLWNWLLPSLFGLATITFWQAAGIIVLARILFGWKGFHRHGWSGHGHFAYAGHCHPHATHHKEWMHRRWENLSPEQKEKIKQRWGCFPDEKQEEHSKPNV